MRQQSEIESSYNQYNGVNAILQSRLQRGGWSVFHGQHVNEIARALNRILPSDYYATTEDPLRIKKIQTEPDDLILKRGSATTHPPLYPVRHPVSEKPSLSRSYTGVFEIAEEEFQKAVVIHRLTPKDDLPITRIELLSPTNVGLPSGAGVSDYNRKRAETLAAGLNVVEIHYLDRYPPTTGLQNWVPSYVAEQSVERASEATAYHVAVTKPHVVDKTDVRSSVNEPQRIQIPVDVTIYPFGIEESIPTIEIPLAVNDASIYLDLQAVYDTQFFEQRWGIGVDYNVKAEDIPIGGYTQSDQLLILARNLTIVDAFNRSVNLETGEKIPIDFAYFDKLIKQQRAMPDSPCDKPGS